MGNRLQQVAWMFVFLLALASSVGIALTAPVAGAQEARLSSSVFSTIVDNKGDYSKFAGLWVAHGSFMIVSRTGEVYFGARVYRWCGPNVPQPCDSIVNSQLRYGYYEQMLLASVRDSVASGKVTFSNFQPANQNTSMTLTLGPNDTLIYNNNGMLTLLCGKNAPANTCGA